MSNGYKGIGSCAYTPIQNIIFSSSKQVRLPNCGYRKTEYCAELQWKQPMIIFNTYTYKLNIDREYDHHVIKLKYYRVFYFLLRSPLCSIKL